MAPRSTPTSDMLTPDEIALFRQWLAQQTALPASKPTRPWQALTHLSVHRDREPGERRSDVQSDLVYRGGRVDLDDERAERLLALGAIRPWEDKEAGKDMPRLTAADMSSGKSFPTPQIDPSQPEIDEEKAKTQERIEVRGPTDESNDPQPPPMASDPASTVNDPYAQH